jgi:hypothetical protein
MASAQSNAFRRDLFAPNKITPEGVTLNMGGIHSHH